MDRSLDEILAERQTSKGGRGSRGPRPRGNAGNGGGPRRNNDRRDDFPRDGVRKTYRDDSRKLDDEWVHDRYDESSSRQPRRGGRGGRDFDSEPTRGARLRVDNLHWDLTESDLTDLFEKIGPVARLELKYDNAGRSDGTAFVTYESQADAKQAIKDFDGANAKGQPIRLSMLPASGPRGGGRVGNGRPLADRISRPRSQSPRRDREREEMEEEAERRGIDRYIPGGGRNSRSYSPAPRQRREGGRRPGDRRRGDGQRREGGGREGGRDGGGEGRGAKTGRDGRVRKTQDELDAEMADYFGGGEAAPAAGASAAANGRTDDDIDMIE